MTENQRETEVTVPHLAESLVSATIGKWLKQPGDYIEQYDVLCELITEKVTTEMPSPVAGRLTKLLVAEGETAAVGEAICLIQEPSSGSAEAAGTPQAGHSQTAAEDPSSGSDESMRSRYSPAVLRLAGEHGIRLEDVQGTGLGGRITRKDIEAFVASGSQGRAGAAPKQQPAAPAPSERPAAKAQEELFLSSPPKGPLRSTGIHLSENPPLPRIEVEGQPLEGRGEYLVDVTPIRSAIARNMRQSVTEIPHGWMMIEVDVTNMVLLRNKLKDEFKRQEGVNLTYLSFMMKAVVSAIKDYPIMNSVWAVDKIIVKRDINISLAVGTEDSVLTPVIKRADQKNIAGIAREIEELSRKTRAGKLSLDDMQGGTFTVNNTGSFGSISTQPIINYPQAAIITFESIVKRPVVIQDMIAVRSMANLCLSLDHRILDGVICGRFLQRVKENMESYNQETKLY
ncbi:2-oxo acid dehydrogenase subunit E2 [Paenibacillus doosanensis]|uniref:Dihydrolipoamide acetyltransferase component of pyruvate dehydrogenase complex n=1 Tax=Paenibacillus konkukensis TaxID=2020716 RepID=A0ABY4RL40_9BACL|nr:MULTISPECIES: dihydrolipoamide acetyltransferase family protein [Paenibacillus]MCS7461602.1 2-oxo acid dehydrogenase subunit E2 [Paenibacillus doosanensis]UQZ82027.1 Dihydrolipoyllysine-residue succinyltransferase component of 2-oxoglutarate dehydrogenase complex [Paenibacillus konkukensis]